MPYLKVEITITQPHKKYLQQHKTKLIGTKPRVQSTEEIIVKMAG